MQQETQSPRGLSAPTARFAETRESSSPPRMTSAVVAAIANAHKTGLDCAPWLETVGAIAMGAIDGII